MRFSIDGRFFSGLLTLNCVLMAHLAGADVLSYKEVWIGTATPIMLYSGGLVASWLAYRRSNKKLNIESATTQEEVPDAEVDELDEDSPRP